MTLQPNRIELPGIYRPFERTPQQEISLIDEIFHRLGALGLYREDLLYSGFDASPLDDPTASPPHQVYVMTARDWRETVMEGSALTPPMYAQIAGDKLAIAAIDSSKVERIDGSPVLDAPFNVPVIPKPGYSSINETLVAVILLPNSDS